MVHVDEPTLVFIREDDFRSPSRTPTRRSSFLVSRFPASTSSSPRRDVDRSSDFLQKLSTNSKLELFNPSVTQIL